MKKKSGKGALEKAELAVAVLLTITVILGLLYMALGIMFVMNGPATSFPWYSSCVFAAIYFGPPLLVEFVVYLIIRHIYKKQKKHEKK